MDFKDLLHRQRSNVALLVGNGINRYGTTADGSSWDALLRALGNGKSGLQAQFCDLLASRRRQPRHIKVIS